ncbi:MAG: 2-oxo acid dehydrogenase subunit E2 [Gemmatimonadetes bacterium]|nr:2-oxo acid dehydrogenase subunit E2 [Gemmatimonadota bacterium]
MARVEVPMPQMGESIAEGTVSVWLKKVGDAVARDEPIMEISTDKVDAEIPSPTAGVLAEIVVQEGQTVEVGTIVAYIETEVGAVATPSATSTPAPAAGTPEEEPATPIRGESQPSAQRDAENGGAVRVAGGEETAEDRLRIRSSPLVRRIAAEHGVRIEALQGSGRSGRVTKSDILRHVEEQEHAPAAAGGTGDGRSAAAAPAQTAGGGGDFSWNEFYTHVEHPRVQVGPNDRVEPMNRMTSIIAEHMVISQRISPHVHSYFEVDYSRIDQVRAKNRRMWEEQGVKVTYTAFIAKAVAQALREFPKINATVSGTDVVYRAEVNLGVAVALDNGLIVPVVRNADDLSLVGLSRRINDLATRARSKKLSPDEVQGGTFTLTNPGIFGTVIGFPIINQPQVAIMGVGGVEKRPAVVTDEYGNDAIVARKRGYLSLGYDHRLVNGADGDQFLARVKEIMQSFPDTGA